MGLAVLFCVVVVLLIYRNIFLSISMAEKKDCKL